MVIIRDHQGVLSKKGYDSVKSKMRSTFLWIFPIFLAGTNVLGLTCYFKDYRECIKAWGNEHKVSMCLKNLTSKPKKCDNDEICSTVGLTLSNREYFEQRDCVKRKSICNYNETYGTVTRLEELTGGFTLKETKCGSCDSDLCNVTNFDPINYGSVCYFTDTESCYRIQPNNFTEEAQLERFNCLRKSAPLRCEANYTICYSKSYRFRDNSLLIVNGCTNKRACSTGDYDHFYLFTVGKILDSTPSCYYCDDNLCNNQMLVLKHKPKLSCLVSHYRDCLTKPIAVPSKILLDTDCLKKNRMLPSREICKGACGSIFISLKDKEQLTIRLCGEDLAVLEKDLLIMNDMSARAKANVAGIFSLACDYGDFCNDVHYRIAGIGLECYQSSLIPCLENLSLIIPQERMFECVKNMNLHKSSKRCKIEETCTTIILHLGSGDIIRYLTCGTGPQEVCVNMLKEINMEKMIGKKIVKAECEYCDWSYCNTEEGEKWATNVTSAKTIQCYLSDFEFCRNKLHDVETKPSPTELKEIQEEMYECLRNNPLKTTTCHGCLTVTFFFEDKDKVIQAAFCDNVVDHLEKCDVHHMDRKYFFDLLGLKLEHWRCNRCLTPLCNNATISSSRKKSEEVVSLAVYRMYSFSLILVCFNFVLLS